MIFLLLVCIKIFLARIVDVTLGSIRTILMVKGKSIPASIIAFLEVFIWFIIAKEALNTPYNSLLIPVFYAGGYATGTLLGTYLSNTYVSGIVGLQVITKTNNKKMIERIRKNGYGVSIVNLKNAYEGHKKEMLIIQVNKKSLKEITNLIKEYDHNAFIIANETKYVQNGLIK